MHINQKVYSENLLIQDMENMVEKHAKLHSITVNKMAFYPNGERVLNGEMFY